MYGDSVEGCGEHETIGVQSPTWRLQTQGRKVVVLGGVVNDGMEVRNMWVSAEYG